MMNSPLRIATSDGPDAARPGITALEKSRDDALLACPQKALKKVLLVSNEVMHYRVPVYNYFHRRFRDYGFEFSVIANRLQAQNQTAPEFELRQQPWDFWAYRQAVLDAQPVAVILFLHLKDWIIWPLTHWLKLRRTPFAFWTKGMNWDAKNSTLRHEMFNYVHAISDALILYAERCRQFIEPRFRAKAFVANNTVNFEDYPTVAQDKEEIKLEFGIPFKKTVIFIGQMATGKGRKRVDHLIDVFRELDRPDIGLVLVGQGLNDQLKARLNTRNTLYLGEVHDPRSLQISKLCKMADVCAIPGHVGLGLNQAFYWGLPVITENRDDHPPERAYLRPGRNGLLVPPNDLVSLREAILTLLDNDEMRAEFSCHAREDILSDASTEGMFSGFKACVEYLTSQSRIQTPE